MCLYGWRPLAVLRTRKTVVERAWLCVRSRSCLIRTVYMLANNKRRHKPLNITLVQMSRLLVSLIIVISIWWCKSIRQIIWRSAQKQLICNSFHLASKWSKSTQVLLEDIHIHNLNRIQIFFWKQITMSGLIDQQTISN